MVTKNYPRLLIEFAKGDNPYNHMCDYDYDQYYEQMEGGEQLCFLYNFYGSREKECHEAWLDSVASTFLETNLDYLRINDSKYI